MSCLVHIDARRILLTIVVVGTTALVACSTTRTVVKPNPQPKTSYEMLVPKGVLRYTLEPGETAVQPVPEKQVAPIYPVSLVRAGAAPVTVVAQLVMDKNGRVEGVYPVSDTATAPDRALFEAAVKNAATQWTFSPLRFQHMLPEGSPYPYVMVSKPFSLWYVFHFKVVNGKPLVETVKR